MMNTSDVAVLANHQASAESFFGFDDLAMVNSGEVLFFSKYGDDWAYGVLIGSGKMMSIYEQLGDSGVPSSVYVTSPRIRDTFHFRIARPEEYATLAFSYGYQPRPLN
jgi:hypothetical protein